ncbi:hypothetical protein O0L34_g48 [Tuta absoluta]|nr:hypothetical protein O0L34_g48 [Tuta absoluta]
MGGGAGARHSADIKRLTDERNAAMQEYTLIMSERDTVHKEMEKLSDDLQAALKRVAALESALQASREEQRATALQAESLRREIESALVDRDRAIKECTDLKTPQNTATLGKSRQDNSAYHHLGLASGVGNDGFLNGQSNDPSLDKLQGMVVDGVDKERVDNLEQANQELERLRKQIDRLQAELADAQREAEVSKRRRDWAFSERDKLLQERESVKALCNRLRKERDQMVGELAEARRSNKKTEAKEHKSSRPRPPAPRPPRTSGDIDLQVTLLLCLQERDQMVGELAEARRSNKKTEAKEHKSSRPRPPAPRPPRTSGDIDLQDFEWDVIDVELSGLGPEGDLGFELSGGRDEPYYPNDCSIYVTNVKKGSVAEGKIKILDRVTEACGVSVWSHGHAAMAALRGALQHGAASLRLQRAKAARAVVHLADARGVTLQHGECNCCSAARRAAARRRLAAAATRQGGQSGRAPRRRARRHAAARRPERSCTSPTRAASRCSTVSATVAQLRGALQHGAASLRLQRAKAARAVVHLADARGVTLQHGIFISKIACGSLASKEGNIYVGDRVVSINNRSLEGVKSVSEAMMLLNDCQFDSCAVTVLRPLYPCNDTRERFSMYERSFDNKMVNICSQTDEPYGQFPPSTDPKVHTEQSVADFDRRYVYHVSAGSQGKIHQERGTWDMIRGKIEAVTGRSKSKDKQNKVPESDAIAELDSVIDSYHGKTIKETSSVLKRSRRKNKDSQNDSKNGGTWPKARANFILEENSTGTIVQPRSRKERPPLSILLSPPTKLPPEPQRSNTNRNSNPIPLGHAPLTQVTAPARHSVYKSIESSPAIEHFPKPAPLAIHNPFASPNNFEKIRTIEKDKMSISDYSDHDITPNRLSLVLNPSDDSLDYQPVTRNRTKSPHSLDFMVNKGPSSLDFVTRKSPSSLEHSIKNHPGKDILEQYYQRKKSSSPKTVVNTYPSDSDSFGPDSLNSNTNFPMTGTLPSQSKLQSQYYRGPFVNSNPHSRYSHMASPTNIPQSQSGESLGTSYEIPSFTSHTHNMSDLQPVPRPNRAEYHHTYEGGTFPRKKENQRFRIPSNPSVTSKNSAGKLSTGSIERSSERNSPMPTFHVEVLSPGRGAKQIYKGTRNSMPEYSGLSWNKPLPGELRRVHIDKSQQPLGIQIYCPPSSGGVFVSTVYENSLASQVGLQIGDQLLEVCGINMRSATYTLAANVLRQIGNSITMLVQYSPEKYKDEVEVPGSSSSGESSHDEEVSLSGSPTPRNSPGPQQSLRMEQASNEQTINATLSRQSQNKDLPRFLLIEMRNHSDLGISLVGGNAVGIYVHSVQIDSPAYVAGLRTGDQILEYNNVDLRRATAEQAALELAKPADKVSVLVRHDLSQYHEIKDKPGDAFYIRAGFDRCAKITSTGMDAIDEYTLWFSKDDVLFVDNTLFNGAPGLWRAWTLDCKGVKRQWGTIPSKFKVEEVLRRSMGTLESDAQRRASTTARRSFFRRKKHRDSKELASFSNTELGCWSDSGTLADDMLLMSYQKVERLHYGNHRPVVVLGPLWECVAAKLVSDWPYVFGRVRSESVSVSGAHAALERGTHVEPRVRRDSTHLDCIPLHAVTELAEKGIHCILDISVATIEKLHKQQIYPIVLFIKFKSFKQIKEVKVTRYPADKVTAKAAKEMYEHGLKVENEYRHYISGQGHALPRRQGHRQGGQGDVRAWPQSGERVQALYLRYVYVIIKVKVTRYPADKVTAKAAKEMYEHGLKVENEYRHYISAEIPAGVNIAYMCTQIKEAVEEEQNKPLWVPSVQA